MKYVALLRGINVGGNKKVPMTEVKKVFELLGFTRIHPLLNSGNIIFQSSGKNTTILIKEIEQAILKHFGFEVPVLLQTDTQIESLIKADPFKKIQVTPNTRLYVTFLSANPQSKLKIPYETKERDFKIISTLDRAICSVLTLSKERGTIDCMKILEIEYGKKITTRNWNTVVKIAGIMNKS